MPIPQPLAIRPELAAGVARLRGVVVALALGLSSMSAVADAQYFGRNKVQYDNLDFRVLPTEHFRLHFYPTAERASRDAARLAERWYDRHRLLIDDVELLANPLIFYADHPDFQQSNVIEGTISQGTGGVTEGLRERVIMPFTGSYAETDHVLGHELVHVFQYRLAAAANGGVQSIGRVPLWVVEGMAEYLSLGRDDPNTAMWLRDAVARDDLPTVQDLSTNPNYFPYRYGQAVWAFIGGTWGDGIVAPLFRSSLADGWELAVENVLGVSLDDLSTRWHRALRAAYEPVIASRTPPASLGRVVVPAEDQQHVSPTISPDGTRMAYFSSQGLFGMDLYLADVATGEVIRQLTNVTASSHFDELSFIKSTGAWSPDGKRFAFAVFDDGDQDIRVVDASNGDEVHRIRIKGVGALSDPAFSPDGRQLALVGMNGGISDLYVYDFETEDALQLTDDREAQLHPTWNPDGQTIAYATDTGVETDFSIMHFGEMRLALIAPATLEVRLLPRLGDGKHINPQFTADGRSLLFVANVDGVSDVFRLNLVTGRYERLTHSTTGVSGIGKLSPAISLAPQTGTLLLSVFNDQQFSIRAINVDDPLPPVASAQTPPAAGMLPPAVSTGGIVSTALRSPTVGLPDPSTREAVAYDSRIRLDAIGGAQVGVTGGGGFANGVSGGVAFGFSDQLGNKLVQTSLRAEGELADIGGQFLFLNRTRRVTWGLQAYHEPTVAGFANIAPITLNTGESQLDGEVYTRQLQRQYYQSAQGLAYYPLSSTKRIEFSMGAQRVAFTRSVDSIYSIQGSVVRNARQSLPSADALIYATATAAFVGDNSFAGFTSPIAGSRYRFEVSPSVGDLSFTTAIADYRRYQLLGQVTVAARGMHIGRYGADASTDRVQPLFLGATHLLRGYDANSFGRGECSTGSGFSDCPELSRLLGSRVGVVNLEVRIPLLGTESFGLIPLGFLPVEVAPFIDGGLAWSNGDEVDLRFSQSATTRVPVFSTGVAVRTNLGGFAVAEFFWARAFQRPGSSGRFGFQLQPGW